MMMDSSIGKGWARDEAKGDGGYLVRALKRKKERKGENLDGFFDIASRLSASRLSSLRKYIIKGRTSNYYLLHTYFLYSYR